ncbi:MAG: NAD(P)-dependent alcohol dehydrogenase [Prevotellaceae bacterium]|nr:NAD(P)-dependent alcohol dehydrogenase [Prevotellaceae bacterium]
MKKTMLAIIAIFACICIPSQAQDNDSIPSKGYAMFEPEGHFKPYEFKRHPLGDDEILIDIVYSSICHSDVARALGHWGATHYPLVPGHEIVGKVTKVGKNVEKFKVGDYAGVGALVNSCGKCKYCMRGEEPYCKQKVLTFHGIDFFNNDEHTQGGFSNNLLVSEHFAVKVPDGADLKRVAPLLCAGITVYSPLQFTKVNKGDKVAVAGFGGLGHLALKYAVKMGAEVTVFDRTEAKRQAALDMGAVKYVNVNNPEELKGMDDEFMVIINSITTAYDPVMYLNMLQQDGDFVIVGIPSLEETPHLDLAVPARLGRKKIYGSQMGGIEETQRMLDYSVNNNIYPDVEMISIDQLDNAFQKLMDGEVMFRYVIDMSTLK